MLRMKWIQYHLQLYRYYHSLWSHPMLQPAYILLVGISSIFICLELISIQHINTSDLVPLPSASLPTSPRPYLQPTPGHESIWIHMNFQKSQLNLWSNRCCLPSPGRRTLGHLVQGFSSPAQIPTAGEILSHHLTRCCPVTTVGQK